MQALSELGDPSTRYTTLDRLQEPIDKKTSWAPSCCVKGVAWQLCASLLAAEEPPPAAALLAAYQRLAVGYGAHERLGSATYIHLDALPSEVLECVVEMSWQRRLKHGPVRQQSEGCEAFLDPCTIVECLAHLMCSSSDVSDIVHEHVGALLHEVVAERDGSSQYEMIHTARMMLYDPKHNRDMESCGWGHGWGAENGEAGRPCHVQISYEWEHQQIIRRINESLTRRGFLTYLDVDQNSSGDDDKWFESLVLGAELLLAGVSQAYQQSASCRLELEYYGNYSQWGYNMIPLMLQKDYTPTGWLALFIGARICHDFWGADINNKVTFEKRMDELVRDIGERGLMSAAKEAQAPQARFTPIPEAAPPVQTPVRGLAPTPEPATSLEIVDAARVGNFATINGRLGEIVAKDRGCWVRFRWLDDGRIDVDWTNVDQLSLVIRSTGGNVLATVGSFAEAPAGARLGEVVARENSWVRLRFVDDGSETADWLSDEELSGILVPISAGGIAEGTLATVKGRLGQVCQCTRCMLCMLLWVSFLLTTRCC
jgi:hypothetical protein